MLCLIGCLQICEHLPALSPTSQFAGSTLTGSGAPLNLFRFSPTHRRIRVRARITRRQMTDRHNPTNLIEQIVSRRPSPPFVACHRTVCGKPCEPSHSMTPPHRHTDLVGMTAVVTVKVRLDR